MKIIDYIKDKLLFLALNFMIFFIIAVFMYSANVNWIVIFAVLCLWFVPMLTYMLMQYLKFNRYFNGVDELLENLDKKYLLPEVLNEPSFIEGKKINEVFKILSRDMHENVKHYRNIQEEYREYIEMWVHEIKNPIASTKLLIENNPNETTRKIDMQMNRIENYVEQVLYYSRSDEVGKDYIIKKVQLDKIVKSVVKKNYRDFIGKRISLQLGEIEEVIYSDEKWTEFILNQIVGNAIKYSKGQGDIIKIKSNKLANSVVLTIEDNGVGIIERDLKRVFDKGFTGENGRKFGKSTGIGLYLCKKLCTKMGLGLDIESQENVGTKVSIIFPQTDNLV
ncbi:sensor histidine kinase [Intestinibacter sp.]